MRKHQNTRTGRVTRRKFLVSAAAAGIGATASPWLGRLGLGGDPRTFAAAALRRGGTLKIAEIGEPLTLDPSVTTADVTATIVLPVYEELFALNGSLRPQPHLVSAYTLSKDGATYTFTLRQGVTFHNGKTLGPDDVVASLNRWGKVSSRGQLVYQNVESVSASGSDTVVMKFKVSYAPLLAFLAHPPGGAAIMPKEVAETAGTQPLKQVIGTGPYKFVEWAPDRYVHLARFDQYAQRSEPANGYGGRKDALADEIYFYPVTQVATRIAGVQSGTYDIADGINQDAYNDLVKDPRVDPGPIPGSFLFFVFNNKQGAMTNMKLRQAVAVALDMGAIQHATFGNPALYSVDASVYPKGTAWYTEAGGGMYNVHSVDRAKALAKEAGYTGQPIRWLTTQDYDYMFKSTVVAATQLQRAGVQVDMQVMDFASIVDRRSKPAAWDVFVASQSPAADPSLINVFNSAYPGWWDTATKNALLSRFSSEIDQAKRVQLWAKLQALAYEEAPVVPLGGWSTLVLSRKGLPGFRPSYWIVPWNVQAVK